ncbi:hypothetical protein LP417_35420 (plasmid) [Polaromonas sp. P1-6]|nr:hypothetical protein LP417_35420 [Polaromonas sp. P1-6]
MTNSNQTDGKDGTLPRTSIKAGTGAEAHPNAGTEPTSEVPQADAKVSGSIRINFIVSSTDIGFESLYHELSKNEADTDRAKHVKRMLHGVCEGKPHTKAKPLTSQYPSQQQSYKITFRLSGRDIGLEKLYNELVPLATTFERNQHVRRMLFNAYVGILVKPVESVPVQSDPATSSQATPYPAYPVATASAATEDNQEERRLKRKNAVSTVGF